MESGPPMWSPRTKTSLYAPVHGQLPAFCILQVFLNASLGRSVALSTIVTSPRNSARLQATSSVGVGLPVTAAVAEACRVVMIARVGALIGVSVSVGRGVLVGAGV